MTHGSRHTVQPDTNQVNGSNFKTDRTGFALNMLLCGKYLK